MISESLQQQKGTKKRGTSRFPPDSFRIREGELIKEVDNASIEKAQITDNTFTLLDDYQANVQLRNQQYQESKNFEATEEEEDDEEDEYE